MSHHAKSAVLVVDDDDDVRETLRDLLEEEGFDVATAGDGKAALEALSKVEPRVLLLDLYMPVMDGWQLIEQLRSDGRLERMKVILTTSLLFQAPIGMQVLEKPIDLDELLDVVHTSC
jgi:CheY-like chemotaxis protein